MKWGAHKTHTYLAHGNYFLAPNLKKKAIDCLVGQMDRDGDDEERNKILLFAEQFQRVLEVPNLIDFMI